jgi:imidazolonepropionase-like amidohydrolase
LKRAGYSIAFLHHRFPAAMLDKVVAKTKHLHIATIGEMQYARYRDAANAGVQAFVHTMRYTLEAYPDSLRNIFIHYPSKQGIFDWYDDTIARKNDPALVKWTKYLAQSHTALIPTLAMSYSMQKEHDNLWKEPVAAIIDSSEIHMPMNKQTGLWTMDSIWWKDGAADHTIASLYVKAGCHFLTGSGTDAFGTMPGISEHIEIKLLNKYGLTKRQAIAAATNNFFNILQLDRQGLCSKRKACRYPCVVKNPLDDLNNLKAIELLFLNGQKINREGLLH